MPYAGWPDAQYRSYILHSLVLQRDPKLYCELVMPAHDGLAPVAQPAPAAGFVSPFKRAGAPLSSAPVRFSCCCSDIIRKQKGVRRIRIRKKNLIASRSKLALQILSLEEPAWLDNYYKSNFFHNSLLRFDKGGAP